MDWIKITTEDLECALNKPQLEILKAERLRSPNRDIAFEAISNVVARIRAEIAASGLNSLDTDHSRIPPELKEPALRLCVEALQARMASMELSKSQTRLAEAARNTLERIARGELPVSSPICAIRTASPKKGFSAGAARRLSTRKTTEGI